MSAPGGRFAYNDVFQFCEHTRPLGADDTMAVTNVIMASDRGASVTSVITTTVSASSTWLPIVAYPIYILEVPVFPKATVTQSANATQHPTTTTTQSVNPTQSPTTITTPSAHSSLPYIAIGPALLIVIFIIGCWGTRAKETWKNFKRRVRTSKKQELPAIEDTTSTSRSHTFATTCKQGVEGKTQIQEVVSENDHGVLEVERSFSRERGRPVSGHRNSQDHPVYHTMRTTVPNLPLVFPNQLSNSNYRLGTAEDYEQNAQARISLCVLNRTELPAILSLYNMTRPSDKFITMEAGSEIECSRRRPRPKPVTR